MPKSIESLVLLVGNLPQRPILSLSHASTHSQQPNLTSITPAPPLILHSRIQTHTGWGQQPNLTNITPAQPLILHSRIQTHTGWGQQPNLTNINPAQPLILHITIQAPNTCG